MQTINLMWSNGMKIGSIGRTIMLQLKFGGEINRLMNCIGFRVRGSAPEPRIIQFVSYFSNKARDEKIMIIAFIFLSSLMSYQLFACTVFYAAKDNIVLAGNNEDFLNAEAYIQFLPAEAGKHGRIYFGFCYEKCSMGR
jgi:hypothetical protein